METGIPLQPSVVIQRFAERFGHPEWMYRGTDYQPGGTLPAFIPVTDALRIITNGVIHGDLGEVLTYAVNAWRTSTLYALIMGFETAPTLGDAVELLAEFGGFRNGHFRFPVQRDGARTTLLLQPVVEFGDAAMMFYEPNAVGFFKLISQMRLGEDNGLQVSLPYPNHGFTGRFWPDPKLVRFDQPFACLQFPTAWESMANPRYDPDLWQIARQRCAAAATALKTGELPFLIRRAIDQRIADTGKVPNLSEIATRHGVSARTLIRQLKAIGTSYKQQVDEVQKARALELLKLPGARVYDVAEQLGFADSSSFGRTFRRWYGTSPSRIVAPGQGELETTR